MLDPPAVLFGQVGPILNTLVARRGQAGGGPRGRNVVLLRAAVFLKGGFECHTSIGI